MRAIFFCENYYGGGLNLTVYQYFKFSRNVIDKCIIYANNLCITELTNKGINPKNCRKINILSYGSVHSLSKSKSIYRNYLKKLLILARPVVLLFNIFSYFQVIFKENVDIVAVFNGGHPASEACLAMAIAGRLSRKKVIYSIVSTPANKPFFFGYETMLDKLLWTCCTQIIVNGEGIGQEIREKRNAPKEKIKVIRNCLPDLYRTPKPSDQLTIGVICRLDKDKNIRLLINAFSGLVSREKGLKLIIVGTGDEYENLEKLKSLSSRLLDIHFMGEIKDEASKAELLSSFDIFAFPSLREGFPYSILEAMRAGCAIVSNDVGSIREAIFNLRNGILTKPYHSNEFRDALQNLCDNSDLRVELGKNARADFLSNYTEEYMRRNVQGLFESLN